MAAKQAVNFEDLKVFDTYNWLLDGPQKDAHTQWVKLVFDAAGAGTSACTPLASADNTSRKNKVAKTKAEESSSTMSLFKKRRVT